MSLPLTFTSLLLFCLLIGCTNNDSHSSVPTPDNVSDSKPSALDIEPPATQKKPAASHIKPSVQNTVVVQTDLWQRMRDGFRLAHQTDRKRVTDELKWYVNHPEYVERVTKRAAPHLHYIIEELEKRGLPLEFALLPIVESAYDPFAYSHSRAAGLWQFIPGTAKMQGLKIDWWYDGRRDVRASTKAAIDYLEYLHDRLSEDWLLALAAYNAGPGNVLSSIRASKLSADEVNFWSLNVFRETYAYVPRLLAISELINHPNRYHMTLPDLANEPYWEVVETKGQLDLNKAAELAEVTPKEIYLLNAGFNQWATHPDGPHELIIPVGKADLFRKQVSLLPPTERVAWERHKVRYGESLGSIANRYRTTVKTIRNANDIRGNLIHTGDSLMIPAASQGANYSMSQSSRLTSKQQSLATHYGNEPISYIVKPGDSFWKIADKFDVGMRELAKWNGMGTTGFLHPRTELKIFKKSDATPLKARPVGQNADRVRKLKYRVRKGESLSLIANKFNISVQSIKSWNNAVNVKNYIHPGDQLTLYVDVTRLIN
jgi:membrane-bound lytic murein transglycosylase D